MKTDTTARICALNDRLRQTGQGGQIMISSGVTQYGTRFTGEALTLIAQGYAFDEANDPHGEHDFGATEVCGKRLFWKIDYYDPTLSAGAEDPSDEQTCMRVLTLMLVEEY